MKKRQFIALALPLAMGLSGLALAPAAYAADGNTIIVGADTTFPPFETQVDGKVTGFDIDMINEIAKAEGRKTEIKVLPFNGIIPSLQAGSIDAAVAGITITKDRLKNVDFSDAYYKSGLSVLVKDDSKIAGFGDLTGHVVATKKATSSVDYMTEKGFKMDNVKQFQNIDAAYQALMTGGADAVIFDNPVNLDFANHHKGVKVVGGLLTGEYYGIAVSKSKPELVGKINAGLAKIKKNGEYQALFKKYFGGDVNGVVEGVEKPADVAKGD
jgi:polar amino acid transport system substrate-binding protein/glutamine transport system substrate-binding protein